MTMRRMGQRMRSIGSSRWSVRQLGCLRRHSTSSRMKSIGRRRRRKAWPNSFRSCKSAMNTTGRWIGSRSTGRPSAGRVTRPASAPTVRWSSPTGGRRSRCRLSTIATTRVSTSELSVRSMVSSSTKPMRSARRRRGAARQLCATLRKQSRGCVRMSHTVGEPPDTRVRRLRHHHASCDACLAQKTRLPTRRSPRPRLGSSLRCARTRALARLASRCLPRRRNPWRRRPSRSTR
mmetsp:Transcript_11535/g.31818  ORF Transcript_11535/g.31818 Transcript_11535/m.31818 type:complete len:234 (-) Transcript_11535:554-1255(-)